MSNILFIGILLILLYYFIVENNKKGQSQKEIQNLEYAKEKEEEIIQFDELGEFPTPQLSRGFKKISKKVLNPINNIKDFFS